METLSQNQQASPSITEGSDLREIVPGLVVEWLSDKCIVVITNKGGASRSFVDAWINTLSDIMHQWPAGRPFLLLQDLSDKTNAVTVYSRERAAALYKVRPELAGRVAVVVAQSLTTQLVRLFLRVRQNNLKIEMFYSREQGLDWLQEVLEPPE